MVYFSSLQFSYGISVSHSLIIKNYRTAALCLKCQIGVSKAFVGGAVCREFESETPAAEEMLDGVICSTEQFSFQM